MYASGFGYGFLRAVWDYHSLVPRPVFDRLQYANTAGEAWEIRSRAMTSGRQKSRHVWWFPAIIIPVLCRSVPGVVSNKRY